MDKWDNRALILVRQFVRVSVALFCLLGFSLAVNSHSWAPIMVLIVLTPGWFIGGFALETLAFGSMKCNSCCKNNDEQSVSGQSCCLFRLSLCGGGFACFLGGLLASCSGAS
jgi:hypothetical protein